MTIAAKPRPAITRSRYHEYTFEGITYPGVTGILKIVDKSDALLNWAARNTAEAALAQIANLPSLLATSGHEGVIRFLTARSGWKNDQAKMTGTEIHALADLMVKGHPLPEKIEEHLVTRATNYADWWAKSGWTTRLSEAYVIHRGLGFGGTFDLLAYDANGLCVLADVKTGRNVYRESILQLAAYGMAELVAPVESEIAYPMPEIDRYVILHTTDEGVREIEVGITDEERLAFRAAAALSQWAKRQGTKAL